MLQRAILAFLAISSLLILATFLVGGPLAEGLFSVLAVTFPVALIALGAQREGRLGPLLWPVISLAVILVTCMVAMLMLRGQILDRPWFGGWPLATAIQVYGVFLLPLGVVSLAYAWTFESFGLRQDDLDALRRRFENDPPESD